MVFSEPLPVGGPIRVLWQLHKYSWIVEIFLENEETEAQMGKVTRPESHIWEVTTLWVRPGNLDSYPGSQVPWVYHCTK